MEFIDLKTQYRRLEDAIRSRVDIVFEHGRFIMGPEIGELEAKLAAFVGARHALTCGSGTDALLLPLMAWGIGPGDAVFVPTFTFFATAEVVGLLGATPVFVDVDPASYNMSPEGLDRAVAALLRQAPTIYPLPRQALRQQLKPRAVIPVDLFGLAADYDALLPLARRHGLHVLEDGAQAFGGSWRGKAVCGLGAEVGATSFFPAKPLGCYGDGGAVFTDDDDLIATLRSLRVHGQGEHKYDNVRLGINGRLDTLQAAILLPKLDILAQEIEARQAVAQRYATAFANLSGVTTPLVPAHCRSAFGQYSLVFDNPDQRERAAAVLRERDIPTAVYYTKPLHLQPVFADQGYAAGALPVAEYLSRRILSLPMHPYLTQAEVDAVCQGVKDALTQIPG